MAENTRAGVEIIERSFSQRIEQNSITSFMTLGAFSKGPVNEAIKLESRRDLVDIFGTPSEVNYKFFFPIATMLDATNSVWVVRVEDSNIRAPGITVGTAQVGVSGSYIHPNGGVQVGETIKITNTPTTDLYPLNYDILTTKSATVSGGVEGVYSLGDSGVTPALSGGLYQESDITNQINVFSVGPGPSYNTIGFAMLNKSDYDLLQALQAELAETFDPDELLALGQTTYEVASSGSGITFEIVEDIIDPDNNYAINIASLNQYMSFEYGPTSDDEFAFYEFSNGNLIGNWIVSTDRDGKDSLGQSIFVNNVVANNSTNLIVLAGVNETTSKDVIPPSVSQTLLPGGDALTEDLSTLTGEFIIQMNNNFGSSLGVQGNAIVDLDFPTAVKQRIDTICQSRKNCIGLLNAPRSTMLTGEAKVNKPTKAIKDYVNNTLNINSSYSAFYPNYFEVFDEFNEKKRWVPCTGHIANRMAFTFDNFDPWWAFAGFERGIIPSGVLRVAYAPSDEQQKVLYTNRCNPIVDFSTEGVVIMGQKTLQSFASNTDRINVRNLYIKVARDIARFSNFVLFAPNDELTRAQWRTQVNNYLNGIFQRRGILEYKVVCDDSNNSAEVVARNEFVGWLLIRPTAAAEFVKITIADVGGTLSFDEVIQGGGL